MNTNPLFSIIVASYNNGRYLSECLESLINQTYKNIEIIVVDDASTDNSVQVIKDYQKKDNRIKAVFKKRNKGVGDTKRLGVEHAKGEILGTIGADDTLVLDAVEIMVKTHLKNPEASLVYSTHYVCDSNLNIQHINDKIKQIPENLTYLTYPEYTSDTVSSFRTFKKTFYDKTEGFSAYFKKAVDKDIIFKLEEVGQLAFINKPLYYYRHHSGSISLNKNTWLAAWWEMRAKEFAYKRRLNNGVQNITDEQLLDEYYFVYKQLALDALNNKKYFEYFKWIYKFLLTFKSLAKTLKFKYYTLKKYFNPKKYL